MLQPVSAPLQLVQLEMVTELVAAEQRVIESPLVEPVVPKVLVVVAVVVAEVAVERPPVLAAAAAVVALPAEQLVQSWSPEAPSVEELWLVEAAAVQE